MDIYTCGNRKLIYELRQFQKQRIPRLKLGEDRSETSFASGVVEAAQLFLQTIEIISIDYH
ncbi:hypothetical protein SAMN05192588_1339 [Nonlabens sp. Hel1_33_55]|nr:hypothetical protein SAMN05192588_1339 [Nonlabens sp. Hel1_33_55]